MSTLNFKEFYAQSLGINAPWKVTGVVIESEFKQVAIRVECATGVPWVDPETQERAEIKDWVERTWRHLDTCEYKTVVTASVPRIRLKSGRTMMVSVPWAEAGGRFTLSFEGHLIDLLAACRTVRGAARQARVTEDAIDGVMRRAVQRGLERREIGELEYVGLDEKAIRKGHRYATILTDIDNGRVIDLVEDRTHEATTALLGKLPAESVSSIKGVAMDMWPAYRSAVSEILPLAEAIFDRFHIKSHLNKAVDLVRRQEHRALSAAGNFVLKGSKYIWMKKHTDLRQQAEGEFRALLIQDLQTGTAWAIKENFDHLWGYKSYAWALKFLSGWIDTARTADLKPLTKVADMIERHAEGILNYIIHPITNATAEGLNSIIQSIKHAARGLPNFQSFRTRILFFLGKLDLAPA